MSDIPMRDETFERDYEAGFARVLWFDKQAKIRGWRLSERQLIREIVQRERAAHIREKSSLPIIGTEVRSAAWNRGQADALRHLLRAQNEREIQ
ncbi:hypothetical protein ccbrp13_68520 [Ktedonobacteria bacterium brp13]|jgi:hypothetical protein|nr:hypothetical protein ccbrp13_68520 [Ktedonobacteria bacterium brp13]